MVRVSPRVAVMSLASTAGVTFSTGAAVMVKFAVAVPVYSIESGVTVTVAALISVGWGAGESFRSKKFT